MKLEQPHAFVALSASLGADSVLAVAPRATLAEPSEGQLVKPGFSNTGEIILEFMRFSQPRRRFLDAAAPGVFLQHQPFPPLRMLDFDLSLSGTILCILLFFVLNRRVILSVYPKGIPAPEVARVEGAAGVCSTDGSCGSQPDEDRSPKCYSKEIKEMASTS